MLLKENTKQWWHNNVLLTLSSNLLYPKVICSSHLSPFSHSSVIIVMWENSLPPFPGFKSGICSGKTIPIKKGLCKRNTVSENQWNKSLLAVNAGILMKQKHTHTVSQDQVPESEIVQELSADLARTTSNKCPQDSQSLECVIVRFYLNSDTHHGHIITNGAPN